MMLNEDYRDMLQILSAEGVEFFLVGAFAMAVHGYPRATLDIDLWVMPSPKNAEAVLRALARFGAPRHSITQQDLEVEGTVFQIGVAPRRIDLITSLTGLDWNEATHESVTVEIDGIPVRIPSIKSLIQNKKATGRTKDLADVEALQSLLI